MHKYLMNMLECPKCHSELTWKVKKENSERIINGKAYCKGCNTSYPVQDEIAVFLTNELERNDLWETGNNALETFFKENPEIEKQLMEGDLNKLSPADKFIKASVLENRNQLDDSAKLFKIAKNGLYTNEYISCWNKQIEYLYDKLCASNEPIIDLASGRGYLIEELARKTKAFLVATDFSPRILKRNQAYLKHIGLYDKVSLVSFDARLTPFKTKSIKHMTTNLGLTNIEKPKNVINELRRIIDGELLSIIHFYSETDIENKLTIFDVGLETFTFYNNTINIFKEGNWNISFENECIGAANPTPKGNILKGVTIDTLPKVETMLRWGVIRAI